MGPQIGNRHGSYSATRTCYPPGKRPISQPMQPTNTQTVAWVLHVRLPDWTPMALAWHCPFPNSLVGIGAGDSCNTLAIIWPSTTCYWVVYDFAYALFVLERTWFGLRLSPLYDKPTSWTWPRPCFAPKNLSCRFSFGWRKLRWNFHQIKDTRNTENVLLALPDPAGPCRSVLIVSSSKVFSSAYQSCLLTYRFWPVNNCVVHLSQPAVLSILSISFTSSVLSCRIYHIHESSRVVFLTYLSTSPSAAQVLWHLASLQSFIHLISISWITSHFSIFFLQGKIRQSDNLQHMISSVGFSEQFGYPMPSSNSSSFSRIDGNFMAPWYTQCASGWWYTYPTPLKNDGVKVSWDDDIPN